MTTDLTGQRFNRLTVLSREPNRSGHTYWLCVCDCGNEAHAAGDMLVSGRHKSCGCLKREQISARSAKHGHKTRTGATATYESWRNMLQRCENPGNPRYPDWGGRGITVCERWHDFAAFLADMGEKPAGLTLDRRENDGPYCPANCHWATAHEQRVNRRHWLTPECRQEIFRLRASGLHLEAIGLKFGVSRQSVARALRNTADYARLSRRPGGLNTVNEPHGRVVPLLEAGTRLRESGL